MDVSNIMMMQASLPFYLHHVAGLQELRIAVVVGVLVGGRFLKCAPIGRTAAGPHPHWSLDSTHHGTQPK